MINENKRYNAFKKYFKPLWENLVPELIYKYDLQEIKKDNMLDIGFGYGILTDMIKTKLQFKNTYAISIDEKVIDFLRENNIHKDLNIKNMNISNTDFKSNFFDFIFSRGSYRFWDNKQKSFNEIHRIMKKDSIALIGGGFGSKNTKDQVTKARISINKESGDNKKEGSVPYPTREELICYIEKAGFSDYEFTSEDFPGMWIFLKK